MQTTKQIEKTTQHDLGDKLTLGEWKESMNKIINEQEVIPASIYFSNMVSNSVKIYSTQEVK